MCLQFYMLLGVPFFEQASCLIKELQLSEPQVKSLNKGHLSSHPDQLGQEDAAETGRLKMGLVNILRLAQIASKFSHKRLDGREVIKYYP